MERSGPDSKASWLIAGACFVVQVLTFGLTEASGLLFVATVFRFNSSREEASLPFTLAYCVRSAIGPLCGYMGGRFGIRPVTLWGCILSPIAVAACFFANDILTFILLWGVAFGISLGLETSLLNVILNEHFIKHRVKANGLNISGASMGTLVLSPIIEKCLEIYDFSGTLLIIAGLMLNSIPAALIMNFNKPAKLPIKLEAVRKEIQEDNVRIVTEDSKLGANVSDKVDLIRSSVTIEVEKLPKLQFRVKQLHHSAKAKVYIRKRSFSLSSVHQPYQIRDIETPINSEVYSQLTFPRYDYSEVKRTALPNFSENTAIENNNSECVEKSENNFISTICSSEVASHAQIVVQKSPKWQIYQLLCDPIYVFLVIGSGIYYFSITTFLTIIVDHATDIGISLTYSTYILMWIAFSDMCGYCCLSWIIERGHLPQSKFAAFSYLGVCLMSASMVWTTHYIVLLVLITLFEFSQCGVIVLCAPLVAELIDDDLQATAIASVTILSSPITLGISPLIGFFRDGGGTYAGVFYVISGATLLCFVLFLCIPLLEARRKKLKGAT